LFADVDLLALFSSNNHLTKGHMSDKEITMRPGNKGLTVKINFWSMEKYLDELDSQYARLGLPVDRKQKDRSNVWNGLRRAPVCARRRFYSFP
jgi:hypothetical protein